MLRSSLPALALCAFATATTHAGSAPSRVAATPMPSTIAFKLDGEFDEGVWEHAPAVTDFRQREPKDGAPPSFATEVKVAYDALNLYVAVRATDPQPDRIVALRTRRDTESPSDWIHVMVDSFHDRRSAFEFAVNPAGVKLDRYWFDDGNEDLGWDAVWDVAVSRDAGGWRAEFRIPFSQLRFPRSADGTFGFAIVREIGRLNETDTWPLLSKSANGFVSGFGELTGLKLDGSARRLELVPYGVAQVKTQPVEAGNPLVSATEPDASAGVDLKYAVRPGLMLTATINPDFGQVEADPAVVNLSGFETFFSERRPFFLEGSGMFTFDVDCNDGQCSGLFYPRRIGRTPHGEPDVPDAAYLTAPAQTTILGATKLTGRVGAYSVGVLNALTADEHATIALGPARTDPTIEPFTSYTVARVRRDFHNQSSVGFMLTSTNRRLTTDTMFLADRAVTGGVDWDLRFRRQYAVRGLWSGSTIHGSPEAIRDLQESTVHSFQRPDADYLDNPSDATSLNGYATALSFQKIAGSKLRFSTNYGSKSPGFDINDVGYMRRADQRSLSNWLQWRNDAPSGWRRSFRINFNQWSSWNYGGDRLDLGGNVNAHLMFANNWGTGAGLNVNALTFDDRATRGGPGAFSNGSWSYWQYVDTDSRRRVSGNVSFNYGNDRHGTHWIGVEPGLTWRPSSFLQVSGGISTNRNVNDSQWVENTDTGHYVFGHLDQTTVSLTWRVNYTITPQLTVQLYAQPFVSAGDYSTFKELVDGRAADYEDRFAPFAYLDNPDFNYRSFRMTNVLRWEYRPGSALFVVWQQGREASLEMGRFSFSRDVPGTFHAPATNVFLVKYSYWINP